MSNVQIYSRYMKSDFSSRDLKYHQFFLSCKFIALFEVSVTSKLHLTQQGGVGEALCSVLLL